MDFNKERIRQIAGLIVFTMFMYVLFTNYREVFRGLEYVCDLISPFVLGGAIAFILNLPMRGIERLIGKLTDKCIKNGRVKKIVRKCTRPVSLVMSILIIVVLVAVLIGIVVPQLAVTVEAIGNSVVSALPQALAWAEAAFADNPDVVEYLKNITVDWDSIFESVRGYIFNGAGNLLSHTFSATMGIISGLTSFFIALIFACYILVQKEKLASQLERVIKVIFKDKMVGRINHVCSLSYKTFSNFITGQCLEACILGAMFFICMLIFRLPYAMLISVLIAFTALIPIVGAFIGCVVGALLILIVNPLQAVFFVIMFLVLQQIEGNLIYPHVVGGSIGLPSMWVLVAVTVGGSIMGIGGIVLFIPVASIAYTLFKEWVRQREGRNETGRNTGKVS